ncbi:tRNA (adenosine(37)-N6)-threonylcarbamoyltransferase complex dimerization subunit type 1 TsaB, partial [Aquicoccus sp. SCR17]|nr:tRNA (adenosine(37)-N6)-threonylcarbamoyltransferase complex dimerization subunit type 1 TsaB [Carideicomes alvinocaridis]
MASPSDPLILGFDTSAAHCAAALLCGDRLLDSRAEEMTRGQAERLMPLIEEMLVQQGVGWPDISRLGVGTGPGNFTGIRISVAAARGLGLGLGIPVIGISTLDAILAGAPAPARAAVPAPRQRAYVQNRGEAPALLPAEAAE